MKKRLEQMSDQERDELNAFVLRFEQLLDLKVDQLLHETQDTGRISEDDLVMRAHLLEGRIPLISEDGDLIYKRRSGLTIQDIVRFAAFMDADAERRKREIVDGDLGPDHSEN